MIVVDASAALELLLRSPTGQSLAARLLVPDESLHAPHLIDLEVLQVLRRYVRRREMANSRAAEAIDDLQALPIARYPHEPFTTRIWALRDKLTAYDAAYVALAETLGATLVTCDAALAEVSGLAIEVDVA